VSGLALSLAEVGSVRQRIEAASAVNAVETIGALLQERNMGTEELLHQLSGFAHSAVTPGAEGDFGNSLKVVEQKIETQIEQNIKDSQTATQAKLDSLFTGFEAANTAANTAKKTAVDTDKSWFECAADEQAKRQASESAEQSLTDSRSNENEACQLQQDNQGFKFDATGKYTMEFACDHSVDGNCKAALKTWQESVLQKMFADAEAALEKDETNYNGLKASCDAKTQARVQAQSSLDSAESAWSTKRASCKTLASQRQTSMCDFGNKAQAKCAAEAGYTKLVAATKQAKGDADSEVDRQNEWMASRTTKCMIAKSMQKGLNGAVAGADLDACSGQVDFAKDVGKLNTRQAELDKLSKGNICADGLITFFNGQTWSIPAGAKPSSKSYTRTKFTPQLDPTSGTFDFCSASAPQPLVAPQPTPTTARVACENPHHPTMTQCTMSKMGMCHGRVRMGHDSRWTAWKTIDGQFPCTNAWFGIDPAKGQAKECMCESDQRMVRH
jgi:hypothetical protein